jgi:hypothetical protein
VTPLDKTTLLHIFDVGVPFRLDFAVALCDSPLDLEGRVHTPQVLREQVFSVELISFTVCGALRTRRAAVVLQAQMLRSNVSLPFVL